MRERQLHDPATGKTWASRLKGTEVEVRSGAPGKEKLAVKTLADAKAARDYALKEEWSRLKKGWLLVAPDAAPGEPRLHRYLGRNYTGAMVAVELDGRLVCNRYGEDEDYLNVIGLDGALERRVTVPKKGMVWDAVRQGDDLLLRVDHGVWRYAATGDVFTPLAKDDPKAESTLAVAGNRAVWHARPDLVVADLNRGETVARWPVKPELYGGHTPQLCAAISPDGGMVACCSHSGRIDLYPVAGKAPPRVIADDFKMIDRMAFGPEGALLFVLEQYGAGRLRVFDVATGQERGDWRKLVPGQRKDFALDLASGRLAVTERGRIEVFDLAGMRRVRAFDVEHVVKRCALGFVDGGLGVQTDYGCASLYAL